MRMSDRERDHDEESPQAPRLPLRRPRLPLRRPHYEPRRPAQFALPPDTIDTPPIKLTPLPELVPPIDHQLLAAIIASGSCPVADVPRPQQLARGSIPAGWDNGADLDDSDLDDAETLLPASDLDDDALTRTNMSPVR
jgi:hypothetical protein